MSAAESLAAPVLHAPYGRLVRDPLTGRLCCHLCGRWFRSLGAHVRVHELSAAEYRAAFGLYRTHPLTSTDVSGERSVLQRRRYRRDPATRQRLEPGQELARTGQLAWRSRAGTTALTPGQRAARREHLDAGRRTRTARAERLLAVALAEQGYDDVAAGLRALYRHLSIEVLAAELGVSRGVLRRALLSHGITVRPPGDTSPAGRRTRTAANEARAAARVGATDLPAWLAERRAEGWTHARLAAAVGRSTPWIRNRLST